MGDFSTFLRTLGEGESDLLRGTVDKVTIQRSLYVEMLCAAFLKETDIPPSEAVLVEEKTATGWRWYIERRGPESTTAPDTSI